MKTLIIALAATVALGSVAFADGHYNPKSNKEAAQGMKAALKGGGGGNNSPLKDALNLDGNGGVASFVSGGGTGGWGNEGSAILGNQVSKRNK